MNEAILELKNLSKQYPGHRAVHNISLSIPRGAFFSLLGPSGCGKTTTLRMIAGFEEPTAGEILLNGDDIVWRKPYERNVSTVFQNYALFPHLNVQENIEFGLRRKGMSDIARRVREVVELLQLEGKQSRLPARLSGGEKQRVALARSLVLSPDVLLLDEPLSALDPKLRKQVRGELKALQRRVGITFLFITHDQEEALSLSDRMAVMNAGAMEQEGTPEDLYLRPRTRFVASFLGAMNWIADVGVRPESTRITRQIPNGGSRSCTAIINGSTFFGNCIHVEARLATGEKIIAELPRLDEPFQESEAVYVSWNREDELSLPK